MPRWFVEAITAFMVVAFLLVTWVLVEAWKRRIRHIPLGRPERAEDVASVVAFLAGPDSDYMTGQAINVDGGIVMGS